MSNIKREKALGKARRFILGVRFTDGLIFKLIIYLLLISIGFVFVYPLLHMVSYSFQSLEDLLNPQIGYVPSRLYLGSYREAFRTLNYFKTFGTTLLVTLLPALLQTIVASFIGYGFARFEFKGKKIFMALLIATYIIPPQVTMIPRYVMYTEMGLINNLLSVLLPASLGQGLYSAIFVLIFYQFYKMIPKVLDEAAQIDGASRAYIYFRIAVPLSKPSFITVFLFSFVWYWNETYFASLFMGGGKYDTLLLKLLNFNSAYEKVFGDDNLINEGTTMSATLLIILPLLIVYFILQKQFIEGIDKAGITGE
ncbi:MAG: carbohydrate ABC transporter permease [Acholeplasmataceae bacterium]|nr:carbohydrate ABC transporter permease [Acholeplasmataceae bacterium]